MKTFIKIILSICIYFLSFNLNVFAQQSQYFTGCQVGTGSINYSNWSFIGFTNNSDQVSSGEGIIVKILVDKHDSSGKIIYAASRMGGLFKSIDSGNTWKC